MLTEDAALINYLDKILKQVNGGLYSWLMTCVYFNLYMRF